MEENMEREDQNKKGVRYTMTHLGDIVVGALDRFWSAAVSSTKGITLTYNIHELKHKKIKVQREIGQRVTQIRERSPELEIFEDEELSKLFSELGDIENSINISIYERESRLYPGKTMKEQCA
ncbi:MAG: hypothetical protein HQK61_07200 [Desulfamplus sp.]|nr:hypothetical protein [Desulfamplus sp.]